MTQTTGSALKEATFEAMEVGEELGPLHVVVDDHYIKQFAFAVDDYSPLREGRAIGSHAAILVPELLRLLNTRYDPNSEAGLHQREEIFIASPARVGEAVTLRGEFVDKYVKRGKGYVVTDATAVSDEDGRLLVRHRATEVARVDDSVEMGRRTGAPPRRAVKAEWRTDLKPASAARLDLPPGTPVQGPVKELHQDQISVFSNVGAFWRTIHTDPDAALRAGSDRTIAQGLMEAMYLSELAADFYGAAWSRSGWMSVVFLAPVFAGDTLTCRGAVTDPETREDPSRLELEVWVENQDGVNAAMGWVGADSPR